MTAFVDQTTKKEILRRPMAGGTGCDGFRPDRYDYWRVGYGTREAFPLDFWVERAGIYEGKPNYATGDFHWSHSTQLYCHLTGDAVFEYQGRSLVVSAGNLLVVPPNTQFNYRGRGVEYHWLAIGGCWPAILGSDLNIRYLPLTLDTEINAKFIEIRETLILQKQGYPIKAIGIFYELIARIEEMSRGGIGAASHYPEAVRNAITYLTENYAEPFKAAETAAVVNVSPSHLRALFEKWLGESPRQFHTRHRINLACRLLREQQLSITEAAIEVGYYDVHHFSRVFKRITGAAPGHFVKELG